MEGGREAQLKSSRARRIRRVTCLVQVNAPRFSKSTCCMRSVWRARMILYCVLFVRKLRIGISVEMSLCPSSMHTWQNFRCSMSPDLLDGSQSADHLLLTTSIRLNTTSHPSMEHAWKNWQNAEHLGDPSVTSYPFSLDEGALAPRVLPALLDRATHHEVSSQVAPVHKNLPRQLLLPQTVCLF